MNLRDKDAKSPLIGYLEERISYLEEVNRYVLDALDTAATLGDFQAQINKQRGPEMLLMETRDRVNAIMPFEATVFFLIDGDTNEFVPVLVDPDEKRDFFLKETDHLIETGKFAWAVRENRPVIVSCFYGKTKLILHVMATSSRVRGMFMGLLASEAKRVHDISLSFLSLVLLYSANALESLQLYERLGKITKSLQGAENYRHLFTAAPDGVEVLDRDGRILDCNESLQRMTGYSREELLGSFTTLYCPDNGGLNIPDSRYLFFKDNNLRELEVEFVTADGAKIAVWRKETALYDEQGRFIGSVAYNRDITRLKKAEEERKELEARLLRAKKMEALGTLAGGVAHDLNNILSGLVSYPDLLLLKMDEGDPLRKPIMTIKKSGEKIAAIVQDLLALGRRGVYQKEVVNLNELIEEHLRTPEHAMVKIYHPHVQFRTALASDLLNIAGSRFHLTKVIMNLLSNASEAITDRGEVIITTRNVTIESKKDQAPGIPPGDYAVLEVSDTGSGISPEDIERIFEPFYSKKVLGRSGTGLGMTVVWGIVQDHQGHIDISSEEGKGTKITIHFPATREKTATKKQEPSLELIRARGEKILVVDDVAEQRDIASDILTLLGYQVTAVGSGEEALAYLRENQVDLVVLDMIMDPGMDGLDTYREIIKIHPNQKGVVASGYAETDRVRELRRLGVRQFIKKPYLIENIGTAVRRELDT